MAESDAVLTMAQQPLPTIGSVTFLFHMIIVLLTQMRKQSTLVLCIVAIIVFSGGSYTLYQQAFRPDSRPQSAKSHSSNDEKTEKITDVSFIQDQEFSVWVPWWDEDRALQSLETAGNAIDGISPLWYKLSADGSLIENPSKQKDAIRLFGKVHHMQIIPVINNETDTGFSAEAVHKFLQNPNSQNEFIASAIIIAQKNGYNGWDIDWEQKKPEDRKQFSSFIQKFAEQLHQNQLTLTITVQAKTETSDEEAENVSDDWKMLGIYADEIRIMAYDFHYDMSEPGAITPLDDLEAVLDYAEQTIPKEKTVLGVPMYGYDWDDKIGQAVQYSDAKAVIKKHNGAIIRDPESEELYGEYSEGFISHTLWFTDAKSMIRILYIANNYGVTRVAFWRVGGEDTNFWSIKK